jgi:hypothetical protein
VDSMPTRGSRDEMGRAVSGPSLANERATPLRSSRHGERASDRAPAWRNGL